jgi:GT2 family glycosyltransferase
MKFSVIVPTYRRPGYLGLVLDGLSRQERAPDQVVVACRAEDAATRDFLAGRGFGDLPLEVVHVRGTGVIAAMACGAERASGDVLCLLDDDAEPLPDWLRRMGERFAEDPRLGALGGRDLLQDHPEMRRVEPTTRQVGIITWYGRITGNHHRGRGPMRRVHVLKGCTLALRADAFRRTGFESRLRGSGAQPHWEMALCLDIAAHGYKVAYDPAIRVIHHIAPRHDADQIHRGGFSAEALHDMVWNEHWVIATRAGALRRVAHRWWSVLVGSTTAPGLVQYARLGMRGDPDRRLKWRTTLHAIREAGR